MRNYNKNVSRTSRKRTKSKCKKKSDEELLNYLDTIFPDKFMDPDEEVILKSLETETITTDSENLHSLNSDDSEYSDGVLNEEYIQEESLTFQEPEPLELEQIVYEQTIYDFQYDNIAGTDLLRPIEDHLKSPKEISAFMTNEELFDIDNIKIQEDHAYSSNSKKENNKFDVTTNIHWTNDLTSMKLFPFKRLQQLTPVVTGNLPLNYFLHILTDDIINEIIIHTNNYGVKMMKRPEMMERYRIKSWKEVTKDEILVFFGLILYMGIIRLNRTNNYWNDNTLFDLNTFTMKMSKKRFSLLLRALHFATYQSKYVMSLDEQLNKIRNIFNLFNKRMSEIYYPEREIIVDESFVLYQGKLILRQYVTDKVNAFGKILTIATPTGIVLKCLIHTDKLDDYNENANCEKIMKFLQEYLNAGHSVYMDNYYNSFELVKLLTENKTHCTGMLRTNRNTLPENVVQAKLNKGESVYKCANGVMIGKWKDTRDFLYISNEYQNDTVLIKAKRKNMKFIPLPIKHCNTHAKRINKKEQLLSHYPLERKNMRWPTKLFIHLLQLILENARHLYNMFSLRDMSIYDFRLSIINSLLNTWSYCPELVSYKPKIGLEHLLIKMTPSGESQKNKSQKELCQKCNKHQDTVYVCSICDESPTYCFYCSEIVHEVNHSNLPLSTNRTIKTKDSLSCQSLLLGNSLSIK